MIPDILSVIEKMTKDEGIILQCNNICVKNLKQFFYYRQVDAVRHSQYCWLFMHSFSPTRQP